MRRTADILTFSALLFAASGVAAETAAVVDGLPAGVIIYDATPASAVIPEPVVTEPALVETVPLVTATPSTQSPASTRSPAQPLTVEASPSGAVILDPATIAPQVDLAPGETVLQVIAVPSIVKTPAPEPAYTLISAPSVSIQRAPPAPKVDPVTGRLRDTPGWTGRRDGPASIGCFPEGACAVLNSP